MNPTLRNSFTLLFLGIGFYALILVMFPAPCSQPIAYSIGKIDPRFDISQEDFLKVVQDAEKGWEDASGKELFTYMPGASLSINLTYDSRQEATDREKSITNSLKSASNTRKGIQQQYAAAYAQYIKAKDTYALHVAAYQQDAATLNAQIQSANDTGGSSAEEYKAFQQRQQSLEQRRNALEQERVTLNTLVSKVNGLANSESEIVKSYNEAVQTLQDEFGADREFGQGEYTGKNITIYEFVDTRDLLIVLEHEFGHALGLGHLPNPTSIMYYLAQEKNSKLTGPTADDLAALVSQCKKSSWNMFIGRLKGLTSSLAVS